MNTATNQYYHKIKQYLDQCYFDVGTSIPGTKFVIDETHLARMLTKIVVSAATIATTTISLKQYIKEIYAKSKG